MTGKSPAELLFGRKLPTKLPEVADLEESKDPGHQQGRDCNAEKKQIGADHAEKRCQAAEKCILVRGGFCVTREGEGE